MQRDCRVKPIGNAAPFPGRLTDVGPPTQFTHVSYVGRERGGGHRMQLSEKSP